MPMVCGRSHWWLGRKTRTGAGRLLRRAWSGMGWPTQAPYAGAVAAGKLAREFAVTHFGLEPFLAHCDSVCFGKFATDSCSLGPDVWVLSISSVTR